LIFDLIYYNNLMPKILKNFFLKSWPKKQKILVYSVFLICGLFLMVSKAQAFSIGGALVWLPEKIGSALLTLAFQLILAIGEQLLQFGNFMLGWAISNPFNLSYTDPAGNDIINIGWTLLRDLTNMFFILGLAYVGLATALNITDFNTKKVFGNLLIIALLINFTPVICGAIVDISNIVLNFFLHGEANFNVLFKIYND